VVPLASADTIEGALVQAYQNNPTLNAQRASVRATDEGVPQALAGYRPRVNVNGSIGTQYFDTTTRSQTFGIGNTYTQLSGNMTPSNFGVTATQTLYNGFQTSNRTRQAESQVQAARETLRVTEQTVLLNAVTAYMNLLRDGAILDLQRRNVEVLQEQLRQTRDRFNVGEVTRTDVAQSESRLAAGRSQVLNAEAVYKASVATYRQVIGVEPGKLTPGSPG
jgi:outer membrane protein